MRNNLRLLNNLSDLNLPLLVDGIFENGFIYNVLLNHDRLPHVVSHAIHVEFLYWEGRWHHLKTLFLLVIFH